MTSAAQDFQPIDSAVTPRFAEPATFMRTPYVPDRQGVEIALVGIPFDLGSTNRAGPRHGPAQIRDMSRLIRQVNASSHIAPFKLCRVADIGDAPVNPLDLMESIDRITAFYRDLAGKGIVPVSAGGDHTVTLPILRGIVRNGPVGVVHFDAHADTLDTLLGSRINHATPFRRAVEEGIIDPKRTVQIGLRGTRYSDEDIQYGYDMGMTIITMDDFEAMGRDKVIAATRKIVGDKPTYVTFDIDGLDPVFCPGTGAPEPGGLTMRDAQVVIRGLRGLNLIGGDVCEVSPPLDPSGHTALNGANLMFEILCVVADSVARGRKN
ncbi:MAG: agmatinase [Alphaproteobacteria bacterium]|nr:agmatinase [Alphaproteobacteria bacterium]